MSADNDRDYVIFRASSNLRKAGLFGIAERLDEVTSKDAAEIVRLRGEVERQAGELRAAVAAGLRAASTLAPAEAKGDELLAAIAASSGRAFEYTGNETVVSMHAVESAIRGMDFNTPQPAGGEAVAPDALRDALAQAVVFSNEGASATVSVKAFLCHLGASAIYTTPPATQVQQLPGRKVAIRVSHESDESFARSSSYALGWNNCLDAIKATHPAAGDKVREVADALRLARNRIQRLVLECPHGSSIRDDAMEWAGEASDALEAAIATQPQEADRG